jgi:predicted dehydrogenase
MLDQLVEKSWFSAAGLVDVNPRALEICGEKWAVPSHLRFVDYEDALRSCDADTVIINTPAELHAAHVRAALLADKHVLVAKPFAEQYTEAVELVKLAQTRGLRIDVAEQMRFHRHYRAVCAFIQSGRLGAIEVVHFLNSKPRPHVGNLTHMLQPALLEMASHHFDLLMALFPLHPPTWIMVDGYQPTWSPYAGPCMINALLRLRGNVHVLYHAGYSSRARCYELRLEGEKGVLQCRGIHMSRPEMTYEWASTGDDFAPVDLESCVPLGEAWSLFLDCWGKAVISHQSTPFSGVNNLKVMALLSAAMDSSDSGQPCSVTDHPLYAAAYHPPGEWSLSS